MVGKQRQEVHTCRIRRGKNTFGKKGGGNPIWALLGIFFFWFVLCTTMIKEIKLRLNYLFSLSLLMKKKGEGGVRDLGKYGISSQPTTNKLFKNFRLSSDAKNLLLSTHTHWHKISQNVYGFQLSSCFACHRCWLGSLSTSTQEKLFLSSLSFNKSDFASSLPLQ